jgi:predicted membrane-bound dolichyl-phosphate-mannose-protein mannosyltransferase
LAASAANIITAGLRPELFAEKGLPSINRAWLIIALVVLIVSGFAFRATSLSAEGLSEDELNKLNAVADYRAHGLTAANGEHPFLMKALLAISLVAAERWNESALVAAHPASLKVSVETALRLPSTLFGAFTALLIYLLTAELFGVEVALLAAALWTFDPSAIGFNRIAKEDTFLLFFFLLANVFWLRGQRVAESLPEQNPEPYYWATGASFGAMLASKYVPQFIAITVSYNYVFQWMPATRWRVGKRRFALFLIIMGAVFLLCNPTILLPDTWRQMFAFAGGKRIAHDGYEFMGTIYEHQMLLWLKGVPWYFYFVFMAVKLPPLTIAAFLIGFPLLFRRNSGDGRYFLLFWMFYWALTFVFAGGKFTRYFTTALPVVLITASLGAQFIVRRISSLMATDRAKIYVRACAALLIVFTSAQVSLNAAPHYRLYLNLFGGGRAHAGEFFPHDEFYDASMREVMYEIARRAEAGVQVASETPTVAAYYAQQAKRPDLVCVSLSDSLAIKKMRAGDFVIAARGRRYFSNDEIIRALRGASAPAFRVALGEVPSVDVYLLNQTTATLINSHEP